MHTTSICSSLIGLLLLSALFLSRPAAAQGIVPDDPLVAKQWSLDVTGAPAAWEITIGSTAVVVVDPVQALEGLTVTGGRLNVARAVTAAAAP